MDAIDFVVMFLLVVMLMSYLLLSNPSVAEINQINLAEISNTYLLLIGSTIGFYIVGFTFIISLAKELLVKR